MGLFSSGSKTDTTTKQAQPYAPTIPGINAGIQAATNAFQSGVGSQPYTASMVTPFSAPTQQSFGDILHRANAWQPYFDRMGEQVGALQGEGGLNALQDQSAAALQGIVANPTGWNAAQQQAYGYLNPIAAGQARQQNPYLDEVISRSAADITGAGNMAASAAGRYGSGGYQGVTQKAIGDMAAPLRFADYNTQQQRMDQAIRDTFGMGTTGFQQRGGAISDLATLGQQQWNNITGLPTAMGNAFQQALAPSGARRAVGAEYEDLYTRQLNDQERIFREQQQQPWQNISNLNAALGGQAAQFGTIKGSATTPTPSLLAQGLGGAIGGASMFKDAAGNPSMWGAAAGGLGSFLGGL